MFLPVLENALKAQKLRTTLGVFERSKFFFNLPSSLMEAIEAVRVGGVQYSHGDFYTLSNYRAATRLHCVTIRRANSFWSHALAN